jgi:hypothetical protein
MQKVVPVSPENLNNPEPDTSLTLDKLIAAKITLTLSVISQLALIESEEVDPIKQSK